MTGVNTSRLTSVRADAWVRRQALRTRVWRHRIAEPLCGWKMAAILLLLTAVALALSACTNHQDNSPGPSARDIVDASIERVEQDDWQAIPSSNQPLQRWLFSDHGKAVGRSGGVIMHDSELLVRIEGELSADETDGRTGEATWVRISPRDLADDQTIAQAQGVFRGWVNSVMTQPLLALESMTVDNAVLESEDGDGWVVRGEVRSEKLFERFLAPDVLSQAVESGLIPSVELSVTHEVDKSSGRPLTTEISAQGNVIAQYSWVRGVWDVPEEEVVGADDYIRSWQE